MVPILCFIVTCICPVQLLCFNKAGIIDDNRYLENNLFGIIKRRVPSARECAVECFAHLECFSFGFEPVLHICHLHKKDSSTAPTDLVAKPQWKHSDISHWPKFNLRIPSAFSLSSLWRSGVVNSSEGNYCKCLKDYSSFGNYLLLPPPDVYQPDVCSEELIPNAACSSESKIAGSIRSCTCHSNYRDVPLDVVSVNHTCLVNGSWTPPLINCTGPYIRLTTPRISTYTFQQISASNLHTITGGTSTVVFLVKACHDANFALHTSPNNYTTDVYEVVIGGFRNRKSLIAKCIQCSIMDSHAESSIVSCNEYRPFWLSWKNGVISAGKGLVAGNQKFMQGTPSSPIVINHVSISTYSNNPGTWLFREQ